MRRFRPPRLRPNAALAGLTPEVLAWEAAVVTNGGTVSVARRLIVNQFILAEKSDGTWALTDDYWALWAESAAQALTSLKQLRLATAVNSPVFTTDRGYAFDGTTNFIGTGFIPSTHAVAMTGTSMRLEVYERTNVASSTFSAGVYNATARNLVLSPRTAVSTLQGRANSEQVSTGATVTDSRGLSAVQRSVSTYSGYKNGSPIAFTGPPASEASTLPTAGLFIGAYNQNGTPAGFRACSLGLVSTGAAMSDAQNLAQYNNIQAFATAVGAQV